MAYSSYNEYIVLNNCCLILGLSVLNYIVFTFNLKPLSYILASNVIQALEFILSLICLYNIWRVAEVFVLPYFEKAKIPFGKDLFALGKATLAIWNLLRYCIAELLLGREPSKTFNPSTWVIDEKPENKQLFVDFFGPNISTMKTGNLNYDASIAPKYYNGNMLSTTPAIRQEVNSALASNLTAYAEQNDPMIETVYKFSPINYIKPQIVLSVDRALAMWFLSRTSEAIEDFRIEQMLAFKKYWNDKFTYRVFNNYYDKMTEELYEKIFKPLANSIAYFTTLLATKNKTIANCPPATIGISLLLPRFNNNSDFSFFEVVNFISLGTYSDDVEKQYILDRILGLSRSKSLVGYRFTPEIDGMPSNSQIILHVLNIYLMLKEPYAIPPLVPLLLAR